MNVPQVAKHLYRAAPPVVRALQSLRPFICPFDDLLAWIPDSAHVLDVGCGAGLFLGLTAKSCPGTTGVGFDSSGKAILAARQMAAANDLQHRVTFEQCAVGEAWPEGQFDVVSIIDVLHHIPVHNQREVVERCFAHVRPGGVLLYKDMGTRPRFSAMWNRLHDAILARQWIHYRSIREVEAWLTDRGARIQNIAARSLGPYAHELIVAKRLDPEV